MVDTNAPQLSRNAALHALPAASITTHGIITQYRKKARAKATIGEARGLAQSEAYPAVLAARWAVGLSMLALTLSVVALYVVASR